MLGGGRGGRGPGIETVVRGPWTEEGTISQSVVVFSEVISPTASTTRVSASVTSQLYLLPAARLLSGLRQPLPGRLRARLVTEGGSSSLALDPRPEYLRVSLSFPPGSAVGEARPTGSQQSSRQASMTEANGLMVLPARSEALAELTSGYEADVILIGDIRVAA